MLRSEFDFDNSILQNGLSLKADKALNWPEYYDAYCYAVKMIVDKGLLGNYFINPKAKPFLFLVRHMLELCLKVNLNRLHIEIPSTHNFAILLSAFGSQLVPMELRKAIQIVDKDPDGAGFRYPDRETPGPVSIEDSRIRTFDVFRNLAKITDNSFIVPQIAGLKEFDNKQIQWDFTVHLHESRALSQIKMQYDDAIEFLLNGIIHGRFDLDKIFLPLLFMMRHSMEIALKSNILEFPGVPEKVKK